MTKPDSSGRYAYDDLERVIHERARLGILTSLAAHRDGIPWNDLKDLCALTDGNLSRHLQVLREAGLVSVERKTGEGRPRTRCRITALGRKRFATYLAELERVVRDAMETESVESDSADDIEEGWAPA